MLECPEDPLEYIPGERLIQNQLVVNVLPRYKDIQEQIIIRRDGTPYRSYLYAADIAARLSAVLPKGKPGRAYSVGSDGSLSILALAERVYSIPGCLPQILTQKNSQPGVPLVRYGPGISPFQKN
jgi:nucleoside-diphosphate-sugar epimerase